MPSEDVNTMEIAIPKGTLAMLGLEHIRNTNLERAAIWHPGGIREWSALEWAGAMTGEQGECLEAFFHLQDSLQVVCRAAASAGRAANVAKKAKRIEGGVQQANNMTMKEAQAELAKEIGDTFLYLDLLAARCGIDTWEAIRDTFNRVSERKGFPQRL